MSQLSELPPGADELDDPGPFPDELSKWTAFSFMVLAAGQALGVNLIAHTNGPNMGMVNTDNDTAPTRIERDALIRHSDLLRAFEHRIQNIEHWPKDPGRWGGDPWREGKQVHRRTTETNDD